MSLLKSVLLLLRVLRVQGIVQATFCQQLMMRSHLRHLPVFYHTWTNVCVIRRRRWCKNTGNTLKKAPSPLGTPSLILAIKLSRTKTFEIANHMIIVRWVKTAWDNIHILSALCIVDKRWAITKQVLPFLALSRASWTICNSYLAIVMMTIKDNSDNCN